MCVACLVLSVSGPAVADPDPLSPLTISAPSLTVTEHTLPPSVIPWPIAMAILTVFSKQAM